MDSKHDITIHDLKEIAVRLRKFSKGIIKVQVNASRESILRICRDEPTHKNIDIIRSATIDVDSVRFELIKKD